MDSIKLYIIRLILISFFVQFSGLVISGEKHKKLFKLVSAVLILSAIISFPKDEISMNLSNLNIESIQYEYDSEPVKEKFLEDLSKLIEDDLLNNFNVKSKVDAQTNFSKMIFNITLDIDDNDVDKISRYVRDNYCTEKDEVYIHNEPDI